MVPEIPLHDSKTVRGITSVNLLINGLYFGADL
jgi:hypothetical protein